MGGLPPAVMTLELLAGLRPDTRRYEVFYLKLLAEVKHTRERSRSGCRVQIASPPVLPSPHDDDDNHATRPRRKRSTSKSRTISPSVGKRVSVATAPTSVAVAVGATTPTNKKKKNGLAVGVQQGFRLRSNTVQKEKAQKEVKELKEQRAAQIRERKVRNATGAKVRRSNSTDRPTFAQPTISSMAPTLESAWDEDVAHLNANGSSNALRKTQSQKSMSGLHRRGSTLQRAHSSRGVDAWHSGSYDPPSAHRDGPSRTRNTSNGPGSGDICGIPRTSSTYTPHPYSSHVPHGNRDPANGVCGAGAKSQLSALQSPPAKPRAQTEKVKGGSCSGKLNNSNASNTIPRGDSGLHQQPAIRPILKKASLIGTPQSADAHLVNTSSASPVAQVARPPVIWA